MFSFSGENKNSSSIANKKNVVSKRKLALKVSQGYHFIFDIKIYRKFLVKG